ncbi:MAG: fasciclin domain-containing protein [Winogradskyella sp.]|uniref:fasciclin domain-containing protein n=1 Tax=Winogradskyella sp. TaxID=1883156 RepID=UPI00385D3C65
MKTIKTLSILALGSILFFSCGEKKKDASETVDTEEVIESAEVEEVPEVVVPNIVGVASGNENFSTLVAAVSTAGLAETLSSEGPFTVFAPTNDAFAKLPAGTVDTLLKPENKEQLTGVLTYHVVAGNFGAAAVIEAINNNDGKFTVSTVQGGDIELSLKDGNVMLKDANGGMSTVVIADVAASNGVIHAIDSVVMPK